MDAEPIHARVNRMSMVAHDSQFDERYGKSVSRLKISLTVQEIIRNGQESKMSKISLVQENIVTAFRCRRKRIRLRASVFRRIPIVNPSNQILNDKNRSSSRKTFI